MINYAYENLFKQDSIDKQISIEYSGGTITNSQIDGQNFKITESLCSETQLKFGCCEASKVEFTVGYGEAPLSNETLTISISPDGEEALQLGVYDVVSDTPTADRKRRNIVAVDKMYQIINAEVIEWYNTLFPTADTVKTIKQIRDSFFTHIGIEQETVTLPQDNVNIAKTVSVESMSGKDVITALCEINFCFGHITRDGKFRYVTLQPIGETLYPAEDLYPADDLFPREGAVDEEIGVNGNYISATYEDYYTDFIDKLQIRTQENDIGYIVGTGTNAYVIEGNFLLYGKSSNELASMFSNALDTIGQIFFTPANIVAQGNPCLEVGDRIRLHTRYATIDTYILQRTMSGIQAIRDNYVATSPKERSEQVNSTNHSLLALSGKTNTLTRTIEETKLEVADLDVGLTAVTIQANGLDVRVTDIERELDDETLYYERESGAPTLLNYPAWDFTISIPCDGTMQLGDGLPFLYTTGYNTYDEHRRDLCVDLSSGEGYRFLLENGVYYWKAIEGSDWSVLYNQISELRQDVDSIDLEVSNTELEVADHEVRITNNTASINTQASQISAKVNQSDHNGDNSFAWELKTSGFDVKSNGNSVFKVNSGGAEINGKVTAKTGFIGNGSNGFTINNTSIYNGTNSMSSTANGIYVGTDGINLANKFKVTNAGAITSTSGKIANFNITNDGLEYWDSGARAGGMYGKVTPANRTGKGIFIDGQKIWLAVIDEVEIYDENRPGTNDIFAFQVYSNGNHGFNSDWIATYSNTNNMFFKVNTYATKDFTVQGSKNRLVETDDYGKRLLYCLETPSPMFEDIGEGKIASDGKCYINIDSTFSETIQTTQYQVFLQCYGNGNAYVSERHPSYFVVEGTEGLSFGWRIVAKQFDLTQKRLEKFFDEADMHQENYGSLAQKHIEDITEERTEEL